METPSSSSSSSRTMTRSESSALNSRTALIDITNDSPIVGLATGSMKTPSPFCKKGLIVHESKNATTPGSGEALLRDQVQNLLQKVEEEAVIKKIAFEPRNFMSCSPVYLLPPTPANTPQFSENNNNGSESLTVCSVVEESFNFSQKLDQQGGSQETLEKNVVTKLLFVGYDSCSEEGDDESVWSVEANASTSDGREKDEELEVDYVDGIVDELCEAMISICVNDGAKFSEKRKAIVSGELDADA